MTTELPVIIKKSENTKATFGELSFEPAFSIDLLGEFQKRAWNVFKETLYPMGTEEAWRRTSLRELRLDMLKPNESSSQLNLSIPPELIKPLTNDQHGGQILFTGTNVAIHLDNELSAKGVIFTDLEHAQKDHPSLLEKVLQKAEINTESKFSALAAAYSKNGLFIYIPRGIEVDRPLHSLFWASGLNQLHTHQIFIFLEDNSSLTFVQEIASPLNKVEQCVYSGNFHVYVGENARLNFVELQSFGKNVWNFTHEDVNVDRNAEVDWIFGALGSRLTKNFSNLNLIGEGSTGKMSGFYFSDGIQHLDHDTQQNHLAPNTTSDLLFKGALVGESRSVWQGMIYVDPKATKTDGYQANRNLVLSEKARADSIPGLEILTDDVRCTHGATVGKIDTDQLFYLESRGIPKKEAEKTIVEGFFDPIMQRIPFEGVRNRFKQAIENKMKEY